jgi:hypothetical protein
MATPAKLASEWFPPGQRTLATSVGVLANTGAAFLLALPVHTGHDVRVLLWATAGFAGLVLLLCLADHALFPPLPPTFPSASASKHRAADTLQDFKVILLNRNSLVCAAVPTLAKRN